MARKKYKNKLDEYNNKNSLLLATLLSLPFILLINIIKNIFSND